MPGPLRELAVTFLRLGLTAFGGPAAHIALMQDEFVRRRGWVTAEEFLDLVGAASLIPGPSSTEVAIFLGHRRAGLAGLVLAGTCFILPAALIVTALAWAYVRFGALPSGAGLLRGVEPVVVAILAQALWAFGRTALKSAWLALVGAAVLGLALAGASPLLLLVLAGAASLAVRRRPGALPAVAAPLAPLALAAPTAAGGATVGQLFLVFLKAGSVVFGSGYVLLAFLRGDLVERLGWLTEAQLVDAVAVGQVTPGPVFTTATFIGYVLQGPVGALAATVAIFLPSFALVALSGPLLPRLRRSAAAGAFLDGVNAASVGLMASAGVALARVAVTDALGAAIALGSLLLLVRRRVGTTWLVLAGAALGLAAAWPAAGLGVVGAQDALLAPEVDVELPGAAGRFDYQAVDAARGHLILTHLGDDEVLVVRLADGSLVRRLPGIPTPRGVAVAEEAGLCFVTSAPDRLVVIDAGSLAVLRRVATGRAPDGVSWDPAHGVVAVSDQRDGAVSLIAGAGQGVRRQVHLGVETGNVVQDAPRGRFWVTVVQAAPPDQLVSIDPVSAEVDARIDLPGCDGAHGLRLHPDGRSALVACEANARLLRVELATGVIASVRVAASPDVLAIDPGLGRLYVATERADLVVFDLGRPGLVELGRVHVGDRAHSVAVDPATHRVYFPLQAGPRGRPVLRIMRPPPASGRSPGAAAPPPSGRAPRGAAPR
jgi:chromate transporter